MKKKVSGLLTFFYFSEYPKLIIAYWLVTLVWIIFDVPG